MRQLCVQVARQAFQKLRPSFAITQRYMRSTSSLHLAEEIKEKPASLDTSVPIFRPDDKMIEEALSIDRKVKAISSDQESIEVSWTNGTNCKYPLVWLRDNCTCGKCYNGSSSSRLIAMADLNIDIKPTNVSVEDGVVDILWEDGHSSTYTSQWLDARSFSEEDQARRLAHLSPRKPQLWGSDLQNKIPMFDFQELLDNDRTLYDWISTLESLGLAIVRNAPCERDQNRKLGDRVAFLRENHYGQNFTIKAKHDPSNLAYTSESLGLHTDLAYYYYTPGVQMLHCIKQVPTEGGENQLADAFKAAYILKERHPELFELLLTTGVDNKDAGLDQFNFYKITRPPVIQCDPDGNVFKITFNNMTRDSWFHAPVDVVPKLYKAMKTFNSIAYEPENHVTYKLQPGDIVCFHNYRVMHGRTGYKLLGTGERHLEGGYMDWDELNSRKRVLLLELGLTKNA